MVTLPEGEDPASLVEKGGAEAFTRFRDGAEDLLDFSVKKIIEGCDTSTPMGRQRAMAACVPVIARVSADEFMPVRNELMRKVGGMLEHARGDHRGIHATGGEVAVLRRSEGRVRARAPEPCGRKWREKPCRCSSTTREALLEQMYLDADYFTDPANKKIFEMLKEFPVCDEEGLQAEFDSFVGGMLERLDDETARQSDAASWSKHLPKAVPAMRIGSLRRSS